MKYVVIEVHCICLCCSLQEVVTYCCPFAGRLGLGVRYNTRGTDTVQYSIDEIVLNACHEKGYPTPTPQMCKISKINQKGNAS